MTPFFVLARPARFERATFGFGGQHSIQLSYGRMAIDAVQFCIHPWSDDSALPLFA